MSDLEFPQELAQKHLELNWTWSVQIATAGVVTMVLSFTTLLTATLGAPWFLVLPLTAGVIFSCIVTMVIIRSLEYVRYTLSVQLTEWQDNQVTQRKILMKSTPNINVKGRNNTVEVNTDHRVQTVENTRLVRYQTNVAHRSDTHIHLIDGVDQRDLEYYIEQIPLRGIGVRKWLHQELPSGRILTSPEEYRQLVAILVKAGIVKNRTERSAGTFTVTDPDEMKRVLGIDKITGFLTETSSDSTDQTGKTE